jgi:hypothetical protein
MVDAYTKLVLTVIAVALSVIAFRISIPTATAQFGELSGCGRLITSPCYVQEASPLKVTVR